jgi:hypothetical protein
MSDPIKPTATFADWLANADAAADAVIEHASNASEWGAVSWVGAVLVGAATLVKVAKFIPAAAPFANLADQFLPRLTGRKEAEVRAAAERNLETAKAAARTAKMALDALENADPELHEMIVSEAKRFQEKLGVRDEVRAVVKGLTEDG